jgi:hypothetical protein
VRNTAYSAASFLLRAFGAPHFVLWEFLKMSILDEKEPTISLKLVVVVVSLVTFAGFAGLFALNAGHSSQAPATQSEAAHAPTVSGNI